MKKKKVKVQSKIVTLPIAARMMYEPLADIAWRIEKTKKKKKSKPSEDEFKHEMLQILGIDAFLYSFTPSGEIGSGDSDYRENPQTARIDGKFYDMFNEVLAFDENKTGRLEGFLVQKFRKDGASDKVIKNRLFRFKSSIINLVQLFLESSMVEYGSKNYMITDGRIFDEDGKRVPGVKSQFNKSKSTSFSYKKRSGEDEEEWFSYLLSVEMNRYLRVFVATFYLLVIADLFRTPISQMAKVITDLDMAGLKKFNDNKERFIHLKQPLTRENFVSKIKEQFVASSLIKPLKADPKLSKSAEQLDLSLFQVDDSEMAKKNKKK